MKVNANQVSWAVDRRQILRDVSFECVNGALVGIVGPNGSGKTTLLRCVYRVLAPDHGALEIDGVDVWRLPARVAAQRIAAVLQERGAETEFTVREIVLMGRAPHKRTLEPDTTDDLRRVSDSLARVGVSHLADRSFHTLSGGEKQRVLVARALTQDPRVLVLDEPTTHLDIRHQLEVLSLVRSLKLTTVAVLHDLNLASIYCDRIYVMAAGSVVASGTPNEIVTAAMIREVFGVIADVEPDPRTGRPRVFFRGDCTIAKMT